MIDIIVPYVDENDKEWQKDYNFYKEQEIKEGKQNANNSQAFAEERIRDWDAFRFWFRGVEKNCPWVHKVFLVVQRESQIPSWLNRDNSKLRIVYHDEFIPKELLPTFNTLVIEAFYYRIPDLSEHFIVCNDDFYFINEISENKFFKDGKIIQGTSGMRSRSWTCGNPVWEKILNNNNDFLERHVIMKPTQEFYHYSHLPDGRVKSFEKKFMDKYYDEIYKAMSVSKFRHPNNLIPSLLYIDAMKYTNYGILDGTVYKNSKYVPVNINTNYYDLFKCDMICFNDTAEVGNYFNRCRDNLLLFLTSKFPTKSSFETSNIKQKRVKKLSKVFGFISYLPETEPARSQRIERLNRAFNQIHTLFEDANFLIIAQNWKDYKAPEFIKDSEIVKCEPLGILGARKKLRTVFLEKTSYDYLIMCDDDIIIETSDENAGKLYMKEIDNNPDKFMFLQYRAAQLNMCAISRFIYEKEPMVDIDPQKEEGYEDTIFCHLLKYKYPEYEFSNVSGIKCIQFQNRNEKAPSTWAYTKQINHALMGKITYNFYLERFKNGNFTLDKQEAKTFAHKYEWYKKAIFKGWCSLKDYLAFMEKIK